MPIVVLTANVSPMGDLTDRADTSAASWVMSVSLSTAARTSSAAGVVFEGKGCAWVSGVSR